MRPPLAGVDLVGCGPVTTAPGGTGTIPVEAAAALLPAVVASLDGNIEGFMAAREVERGTLQHRSHVLD